MAEGRGNRPNPQNLQGLLRLAVEAGSASDEPAPTEPMSEERKAWLREALAEACRGQLDEVEQMRRCLDVLRRPERGEEEEGEEEEEEEGGAAESALDLLSELCENLDNARDLMTLGGLQLCVAQRLRDAAPGVRWRAAQLLAVCCQNHPEVQFHALSLGALSPLLALVDADPCPTVRVKALYAVSCLVREQEAALREFLSHDGFSVLMRGMQSDHEKLRVKSAFLLQSLLASHAEHRDTLVSMGMVQQLVSLLRCPPSPFHEHVLGALCCLVCDFPRGVTECRDPALGLEELLKERTRELKGREECQEELEFCERLLVSCFRSLPPEDNGMDR